MNEYHETHGVTDGCVIALGCSWMLVLILAVAVNCA